MDFFSEKGLLAKHLSSFEPREGQRIMAEAVESILTAEGLGEDFSARTLMVEAETGIGKTLAYLVPALLSGKRVVISTATINLQDQIVKKDLPLLEKLFGDEIPALCVKGRQNYLCHYRFHQYCSNPQRSLIDDDSIDRIEKWLKTTETGDRAELDWLPDNSILWNKLAAHSNHCSGADCPEHSCCFINQLRKKAAKMQLLIVNHHLLFSDIALRRNGFGEVLPRYQAVIFDEAHHIENVATTFFGKSISQYQIIDLLSDVSQQAEEDLSPENLDAFLAEISGVKQRVEHFVHIFPTKRGRFPLSEIIDDLGGSWVEAVEDLSSALLRLAEKFDKNKTYGDAWSGFAERAHHLNKTLYEVSLIEQNAEEMEGYVHWYERRERSVVVSVTPVDVAAELDKSLYHTVETCIMTSATLSTGGNFKYIKERLGLPEDTKYLQLASPFKYPEQTKLYVPNDFPEPSAPTYQQLAAKRIKELLTISQGRALVLFTSFRSMDAVAEYLEDDFDYPLLVQGSLPRQTLLESFREQTDSVLLAVASFWEGVDVVGESLSCVIIDKLPFEVPSDPVFKARVDAITKNGGKPFFEYQIPRAILSLRQGVGRLMRSTTDCGLIAVLDARLYSKGYGKNFLKSMPPSPVIRTVEQVETFFNEL